MMKTILIVDDDPYLLESLKAVFVKTYEVATTSSVRQARDILDEKEISLILLDVILPDINGVDFLRVIREVWPEIPVIMISGAPTIQPVIQALELGAVDYIRKPFDVEVLRLVVARALHLNELERKVAVLQKRLADRSASMEPGQKPMKQAVEEFERDLIQRALDRSGGVQTQAARLLGTTRRILRYRIEKLGLTSPEC